MAIFKCLCQLYRTPVICVVPRKELRHFFKDQDYHNHTLFNNRTSTTLTLTNVLAGTSEEFVPE